MARPKDHDFTEPTKRKMAQRVGYLCSNPDCETFTGGPSEEADDAGSNIGEAAHIHGAAPLSRRYNPALRPEECRDVSNGIWLCRNCATKIDRDEVTYTVELLRQWKRDAEARARDRQGKSLKQLTSNQQNETVQALLLDQSFQTHAQLLKGKGLGMHLRNGEIEYFPEVPMEFELLGNIDQFLAGAEQAVTHGNFDLDLQDAGLTISAKDASLHPYLKPLKNGVMRLEAPYKDVLLFFIAGSEFEEVESRIQQLRKPDRLKITIVNESESLKTTMWASRGKAEIKHELAFDRILEKKDLPYLQALVWTAFPTMDVTILDAKNRQKIATLPPAARQKPNDADHRMFLVLRVAEMYSRTMWHLRNIDAIRNNVSLGEMLGLLTKEAYQGLMYIYSVIDKKEKKFGFAINLVPYEFEALLPSLREFSGRCEIEMRVPLRQANETVSVMLGHLKTPTIQILDGQTEEVIDMNDDVLLNYPAGGLIVRIEGEATATFTKELDLTTESIILRFPNKEIQVSMSEEKHPTEET